MRNYITSVIVVSTEQPSWHITLLFWLPVLDWTNNGGELTNAEEMALLELIATWQLSHQCNAFSLSSVRGYSQQLTSQTSHTQWWWCHDSKKQTDRRNNRQTKYIVKSADTSSSSGVKPWNSRNSWGLSQLSRVPITKDRSKCLHSKDQQKPRQSLGRTDRGATLVGSRADSSQGNCKALHQLWPLSTTGQERWQ